MRISDWSSDVCSAVLGEVVALGLGVTLPWRLGSQHLDTSKSPHELHLHLESDRGTTFACRECRRSCKAHDFGEFRWRHLNFFQHHCYITARVPRTDCPEHGVKRVRVPWRSEERRVGKECGSTCRSRW